MAQLLNPIVRRVETQETQRLTHADFMRLAPEDQKAELIEGEMIVMPTPFFVHERLQVFLVSILSLFAGRFDLGQVLGSRTAVYISETDTYEPDILFVAKARQHVISERKLLEAPDLVVEILSASTARYDRGPKLAGYSTAGVRELWLVDPYGPAGTQFFQRQGDSLVEVAPAQGILRSVALPNFDLRVAWLWPDENGALPNPVNVLRELGVV
jgi:Uma2 family endonuclease